MNIVDWPGPLPAEVTLGRNNEKSSKFEIFNLSKSASLNAKTVTDTSLASSALFVEETIISSMILSSLISSFSKAYIGKITKRDKK